MFNMMLGEIAPGGVGSGLYGMLMLAVVTVFLCGLMVGRTPEYLGKKIGQREIVLVALYVLTTPVLVLVGSAVALTADDGLAGLQDSGPHGLSEAVYAVTSAVQQQRQRLRGPRPRARRSGTRCSGCCMLLGRFLPIVFVLALAGRFASQQTAAAQRRHPAHPPPTLRRPPHRRRPGRGRPDLRARARPRPDRGVPVVNAHTAGPRHRRAHQVNPAPGPDAPARRGAPGALRKLDPRELLPPR